MTHGPIGTAGVDPAAVLAYCVSRSAEWEALLAQLVNVDSGTRDSIGLDAVAGLVAAEWERLGFTTREVLGPEKPPSLVAERAGPTKGLPRLLLLGHLDTVFAAGTARARPYQAADGRATGPGVADMKGGLVTMLAMVDALRQFAVLDRFHVTVLHNRDEEGGSLNSRAVIEELARTADLVLVYEPARPDGSLVTGRRGLQRHRIEVHGRAAHSGVDPEKGANAVVALARKASDLHALNDPARNLSVNVGVFQGGTRPNIVPDLATAEVDVRVADLASARYAEAAIAEIVAREDVPGTRAVATRYAERPPLALDARLQPALEVVTAVGSALQLPVRFTATGGGSDGNFTGALGIPTLDGLGPVGGGYHTDEEFVLLRTIPERAALVAATLASLAADPTPAPWSAADSSA